MAGLRQAAAAQVEADAEAGLPGLVVVKPCSAEDETRSSSSASSSAGSRGVPACVVGRPVKLGGEEGPPSPRAGPQPPIAQGLGRAELKAFLMRPLPQDAGMIECRVRRKGGGLTGELFPTYTLELESGRPLMTAQKHLHLKASNYTISLAEDNTGGPWTAAGQLGRLDPDFLGLQFIAYSTGLNPSKVDASAPQAGQLVREELLTVDYEANLTGSGEASFGRRLTVVAPRVDQDGERCACRPLQPKVEGLRALGQSIKGRDRVDAFQNKQPKWNDKAGANVLNFGGRVKQTSVKNFQLVAAQDAETVIVQFGRVGRGHFSLDFRHPFSPFQAFAACLTTFDYKLCCE